MKRLYYNSTLSGPVLYVLLFFGVMANSQNLSHIGNEATLSSFETELNRISETSGGAMGIALHHLETGTKLSIRGEELFPMASTYKVPVAVTLLQQVDAGEKKITDMVEVKEEDMVFEYGFNEHVQNPGIILSLHNLLEPMLIVSDNTSTDLLMEQVGGPEYITKNLKKLGVNNIQVSRNTATLIRDYFKIPQPPVGEKRSLLKELKSFKPEEIEKMSSTLDLEFSKDPQDTTTPNAMAQLLEKIWKGEILSSKSTAMLKDIMLRCKTGEGRLKGILPIGTQVAHKTGTIGGTSNDVGVMTLPNGKGHLIIAIYIKDSPLSYAKRDRAIAEVARAAHDYFTFNVLKD